MSEREFIGFMALMSAMAALSIDMLLPGFGAMRGTFGLAEDSTDLAATITLFIAGQAVAMPFYGPLTDALGRKRVLYIGLGLYALGALGAALAPSLGLLYASRVVWGIGSAGPRTLSQAIVRDRFAGEGMARVMAFVQTAFVMGPIVAPLVGRLILEVGSWRWMMSFGVLTAAVTLAWSRRLAETLPPERRQPLGFSRTSRAFRAVLSSRITLGYALVIMFDFGAFISFLSSIDLVFDDVFGRKSLFVPYFSATMALSALAAVTTARFIPLIGAVAIARLAVAGLVTFSALMVVLSLTTDGTPPLWLFLLVLTAANCCHTAILPTCNSLALEPMGEIAGTAAAVVGLIGGAGGAFLATFINRAIEGTVTPMAVGYLGYSSIAVAMMWWASTARRPTLT
jgi:DHA1 family bicyclomycin/chloramphenicol resistance-like MFS transporter